MFNVELIREFLSFWRYVTCLVTGTTCATVLTQAILTEGCKSVAAGVNVMDLRTGINMAVNSVVSLLKERALMISTPEEISQVLQHLKETIQQQQQLSLKSKLVGVSVIKGAT